MPGPAIALDGPPLWADVPPSLYFALLLRRRLAFWELGGSGWRAGAGASH